MNKRAITLVVSVLVILSLVVITDRLSARSLYSSVTGAAALPINQDNPQPIDRTDSNYDNGDIDSYTWELPDGEICDVMWSITAASGLNQFRLDSPDALDAPVTVANSGSDAIHSSSQTISTSASITCTRTGMGGCVTGYTLTASRSCEDPPACVENWYCTGWYPCQINTQFRRCTDYNECGTMVDKPAENQPCTPPPEDDGEGDDTPDGDDGAPDGDTDDDTDADAGTGVSDTGDNTTNSTMDIYYPVTANGTIDNTTNATGTNTTKLPKEDKTTFWIIIGGSAAGGVLMLTLIIGLLLRRRGGGVMRVMQIRR